MMTERMGFQTAASLQRRTHHYSADLRNSESSTAAPVNANALDTEIGPFYDTATVATLLGKASRQALEVQRKEHTILALKTADRRWVYPTFQFVGPAVDPRLIPAIQILRDAPSWSAALWFVTDNPDLHDVTPLEWAREGTRDEHPPEALTASARRTIQEWQ